MKLKDLLEMSMAEIVDAERILHQSFMTIGIEIKFTKHFTDRVVDGARDEHGARDNITFEQMMKVFSNLKKEHEALYQEASDHVDELKQGQFQGVIQDQLQAINVPFVLNFNKRKQVFELLCKTIMKRKNFHVKPTDHVIKV